MDSINHHERLLSYEACEARLPDRIGVLFADDCHGLAIQGKSSQRHKGDRSRKDGSGAGFGRNVFTLRIIPTG